MNTLSRPISSLLSRFPLFLWRQRILVALLIVVAIFATEFYALKIPKANAAYTIANSARFISGNSDYLSKTFGTPTAQNTWTLSFWAKIGAVGTRMQPFEAGGASRLEIELNTTTGQISVADAATTFAKTNAYLRDPSAWYHIVIRANGSGSPMTIYINGVQATLAVSNNLTTSYFNASGVTHYIGSYGGTTYFYDGYMSDVYFVDGSALAPTCFGATDANGYWRPKTYTTASPCAAYGTNGFHLAFGNGNALGTDTSGNANNFATSTNMTAAVSQLTDSPTNSFATLNPLDPPTLTTLSSGNISASIGSGKGGVRSGYGVSSGKWYFEVTGSAFSSSGGLKVGYSKSTFALTGASDIGASTNGFGVRAGYSGTDFFTYNAVSVNISSDFTASTDVLGLAVDLDSGAIEYFKNGSSVYST